MQLKYVLPIVAFAALCVPAWAEEGGDAFRGKAYAEAICSSCHDISPQGVRSSNPAAKPFVSIDSKYASGEDLATWLNTKHPSIPNQLIKPVQGDDILAFIASLKGSPSR
jgi:hypothetical protein